MRVRRTFAAAALVVVCSALPVRGDAVPVDPVLRNLIVAYLRDPRAHGWELRERGRDASDAWPPGFKLALADAYVRGGQAGAARGVLGRLVDGSAGPPWSEWAVVGLGWLDFAAGNLERARERYEQASTTTLGRPIAPLMLGLIDAAERRTDSAVELRTLAGAPGTPARLRPLARLGTGYAYYWAGDFRTAAAELEKTAMVDAGSPLADDAAYAAAWSRWRAGDQDLAIAQLRRVAEGVGQGVNPKRVTRALLDLEPSALLRASLKRYARLPVTDPGQQVLALLDADGAGLARAALARIGAVPGPESPAATALPPRVPAHAPAAAAPGPIAARAAPESPGSPIAADTRRPWPWSSLMLLLAAIAVVWLVGRRGQTRRPDSTGAGKIRPTLRR